ncbi:MAG: RsmE family RNA methyltransferase [Nitrospirota bacterium]|nr:RsmE family RNA methyltransferase [Nitrospirota bacterium]
MSVFFVSSQAIHNKSLTIHGPLHSHLTKSLRYRVGDSIWCVDEKRQRYQVRIASLTKQSLEGTIVGQQNGPPKQPVFIGLGLSILKGDHMTWAIQKATELGVHTIFPIMSHRCIVRPDADRAQSYQARWQRIALDAAQQSERWDVPHVHLPCDLSTFLASHEQDMKFILVERGTPNKTTAFSLDEGFQGNLTIASGPEGGWTDEERKEANQNNFHDVTLGTTIFRAETAPLVALALIQSQLGEFG